MTAQKPRLGFIGLGLMGQPMTARLVESGFDVTGYDIDPVKVHQASAHGMKPADSIEAVAAVSDIVHLCLISTTAVATVITGEAGLIRQPGQMRVLVDHSTTDAAETRKLAAQLSEQTRVGWVDAPVSGGPPAARSGSLAIMAGGDDTDIAAVESIMGALAGTFTHMGGVSAGQTTKMVNQVLVLNNYCVLAEALALAEAGGVDATKIPQALGVGHAGSNLLQSVFPRMQARDFEPAGYARQVLKDLDMVHELARTLGVPTPMSAQAASLFRILVAKGDAELDATAVLKLYDAAEQLGPNLE